MKEKINAIIRESSKDNNKEDIEDIPLYTNLSFTLDSITITLRNVNLNWLTNINSKAIVVQSIFMFNWYSYGSYDRINILEDDFIITLKTQKKIELVRENK